MRAGGGSVPAWDGRLYLFSDRRGHVMRKLAAGSATLATLYAAEKKHGYGRGWWEVER